MTLHMNIFRILGDVSHTLSKCILIWAIHTNRSAEGVSLITQTLYALVFVSRYLDLFWIPPWAVPWNFILKVFYITSSFYIIFIMMRVYARTREREKAWKFGLYCLGGSLLLTPVISFLALREDITLVRTIWTFSIILESVCVVPQLLLLRQTTVPTVIDSGYILTLGAYRAFYILNWIVRLASKEHHFEWRAVLFGVIQTAFYVDFAWVYWTRQRVKLRNGGLVDSDDLSRGFLVSRILGKSNAMDEDDEESAPIHGGNDDVSRPKANGGRWGARGISISADDGVEAHEQTKAHPAAYADNRSEDGDVAINAPDEEEDESSGLGVDHREDRRDRLPHGQT